MATETMAVFKAWLWNKVDKNRLMKCSFVVVVVLVVFFLLWKVIGEDSRSIPGHARLSWGSADKVKAPCVLYGRCCDKTGRLTLCSATCVLYGRCYDKTGRLTMHSAPCVLYGRCYDKTGRLTLCSATCVLYGRCYDTTVTGRLTMHSAPCVLYGRCYDKTGRRFQVHAEDSNAQLLKQKIRILCLVMTLKDNAESRALAVNQTWGRRCTKLQFVSSEMLEDLPTLVLPVQDGRNHLTAKTMAMFKYAFCHYLEQFDWFLKADDDTFVVMENLRYLLSFHDPLNKVYVGHHFKRYVDSGYMAGGSGYALNKAALRHFGQNSNLCVSDGWGEDIDFGRCMKNIGVQCYQTKDILGRNSFHALAFDDTMHWYDKIKLHAVQVKEPIHIGPSCCSQLSVSFHYITPQQMYQFEFLLYRMAVYGRHTPDNMFKDFFPATTIPKGDYKEDPIPHFY